MSIREEVQAKLKAATVGQHIKFAEERRHYQIQARDERFIICTAPHRDSYFYVIVDLEEGIRGPDNLVFHHGYDSKDQCEENLKRLNSTHENDDENGLEISYRYRLDLNVDWAGKPPKPSGQSSGRIEATSAKYATDRLMARFQPFDRGTVTLLKNQDAARKGLFWAMKD